MKLTIWKDFQPEKYGGISELENLLIYPGHDIHE